MSAWNDLDPEQRAVLDILNVAPGRSVDYYALRAQLERQGIVVRLKMLGELTRRSFIEYVLEKNGLAPGRYRLTPEGRAAIH
jgi:hypothetical protein